MIGPANETVKFASPAAPGNNAVAVLFNSVTAFGPKMMRTLGLTMLQALFLQMDQASAASGLKAWGSSDGGTTWIQLDYKDSTGTATMPKTIPVCATANTDTESFDVTIVDDFKLELTAGATGPTAWNVVITGLFGAAAVQK